MKPFTSILALIIAISINLLSSFAFTRVDLTEGQIYTLSSSTKNIVKNLESDLIVQVFISQKLPPQAELIRQQLQDYLDEYQNLSNGKITLKYNDPEKNEDVKRLAQYLGVPELNLQIIEKDQRQTIKAYMGLAVIKENSHPEKNDEEASQNPLAKIESHQIIPVVQEFSNFEYDMTAAIKKVGSNTTKVIGFLEGHGEHLLQNPNQQRGLFGQSNPREDLPYKEILEKNYFTRNITIDQENQTINDIDTLIIAGPTTDLSTTTIQALHTFLEAGGNIIALIDATNLGSGLQAQVQNIPNINTFLSEYGISISPFIIADKNHEQATFSAGLFNRYTVKYPFWVKIPSSQLSTNSEITKDLEYMVFPWANPLTIQTRDDVQLTKLAESSDTFFTEGEVSNIDDAEQTNPVSFDLNPEREFSFGDTKDALTLAVLAQKQGHGKLIVVGDSDFATNQFARQFGENANFFLNAIDSLTSDNALINIRSKGVSDRPLIPLQEYQKNLIIWGNTLFIPMLFIGYGLFRRYSRQEKKKFTFGR